MIGRSTAVALGLALWSAGVAADDVCTQAQVGEPLQPQLDRATPGSALCLAPGSWNGPLRIPRAVELRGPRDAVIYSQGSGTTVSLDGPDSALTGVTIDGSGGRFDRLDAAVRVRGDRVRVIGVRIQQALFGILVEQAEQVVLRGNEIEGFPDKPLGLRGDGIRLWEVRDARVTENVVRHSRDLVVWYSPRNRIERNRVEDGRYGTHFMYSHGSTVVGNEYRRNVVGIFSMYSRDLEIRDNLIAAAGGAAGVGFGCKESGNLTLLDNLFLGNTTGIYLDTCPLYLDEANRYERNRIQFSDSAVVLHGSEERNHFVRNDFLSNQTPLRIEGRSRGDGVLWEQNYFDDFAGYDLDNDGYGDVPYELRSFEADLLRRYPGLRFFRGSPAMWLTEAVGQMIPIFRAQQLLRDLQPRMRPESLNAN